VSGKEKLAGPGAPPSDLPHPAGDIPEDGARSQRPLPRGDKLVRASGLASLCCTSAGCWPRARSRKARWCGSRGPEVTEEAWPFFIEDELVTPLVRERGVPV